MGAKAEQNILKGIEQAKKYKERMPLAVVCPRARHMLATLREVPEVEQIVLAGSLRRMRATVADVDILTGSDHPEKVMDAFVNLPGTDKVIARGDTKSST